VWARVEPWLREVTRPTMAITHRGVIRVVLAAAWGWDMRGPPPVKLDWHAAHFFRLDREGRPSIDCLNVR
jgi:probable phosphoglycerate mutase